MTFKRMMALGAMAAALAFTGCQDRSRSDQDLGTGGSGYQTQPAAPSTSPSDSTLPGSSNTIGGTTQDARPGTELGGTGATGGSGSMNDTGGTTNPDAVIPPANDLDHGGSNTIHQGSDSSLDKNGTGGSGSSLDNSGTGGSGMDMETNTLPQDSLDEKNRDPSTLDQRNQVDDQEHIGDTDSQAR